jgi:hypothetical protein
MNICDWESSDWNVYKSWLKKSIVFSHCVGKLLTSPKWLVARKIFTVSPFSTKWFECYCCTKNTIFCLQHSNAYTNFHEYPTAGSDVTGETRHLTRWIHGWTQLHYMPVFPYKIRATNSFIVVKVYQLEKQHVVQKSKLSNIAHDSCLVSLFTCRFQ